MSDPRLFELPNIELPEPEQLVLPENELSPVKVYRQVLDAEDIELLRGVADAMVDDGSARRALRERGFYASGIEAVDPNDLSEVVRGILGVGKSFTARVNVQAPNKSQGWHKDYRPEAAVFYPESEGAIDLKPGAQSLQEARGRTGDHEIFTIPVYEGDLAIIGCGKSVFHRGRNTSNSIRRTVVLHDIPEGKQPISTIRV
jgi:hypothetical protein